MVSPIAALAQQQLRDMQQLQHDFGRQSRHRATAAGAHEAVERLPRPAENDRARWRQAGRHRWSALLGHLGRLHRPT